MRAWALSPLEGVGEGEGEGEGGTEEEDLRAEEGEGVEDEEEEEREKGAETGAAVHDARRTLLISGVVGSLSFPLLCLK